MPFKPFDNPSSPVGRFARSGYVTHNRDNKQCQCCNFCLRNWPERCLSRPTLPTQKSRQDRQKDHSRQSPSAQFHLHRDQLEEAACDVMMSQTILKQYADAVIHRLKKQVLEAEERGFDVETPCLQGSPQACALFQSVQMYKQLQIDAKALKRERTNEPILGAALVLTPESLTPEAFEEDGR